MRYRQVSVVPVKLLACDYEGIRPDILILGKALSGGVQSGLGGIGGR